MEIAKYYADVYDDLVTRKAGKAAHISIMGSIKMAAGGLASAQQQLEAHECKASAASAAEVTKLDQLFNRIAKEQGVPAW